MQAFKGTATIVNLATFDGSEGVRTSLPLVVGEADIIDDLINPITPGENHINFFNTERVSGVETVSYDLRDIEKYLDDESNDPEKGWNLFPV